MEDEILARATLSAVPGLSRPHARRALEGAALPAKQAREIARAWTERAGERDLAAAHAAGIRALAPGDPEFPAALREIPDPPLLVWVKGSLPPGPSLAIVGSRRPSERGRATAHAFAAELARAGAAIISGLAYGVDAAAHEGALAGGGPTVAVLASGLLHVTPTRAARARRTHRRGGRCLALRAAARRGRVPAPLPRAEPPDQRTDQRRCSSSRRARRAARSGPRATRSSRGARCWSFRARSTPSSVGARTGCCATARRRSSTRTTCAPRCSVRSPRAPSSAALLPDASPAARAVLELLADGPCDLDALARSLGRAPRELAAALLELELDGRLRREGTRLTLCSE